MIDHYNDLGFRLRDDEEVWLLIEQAAERGTKVESMRGHYILWEPGGGIQLWVQSNKKGEIIGCKPHFKGRSRITLEIEELIQDSDSGTEMEGLLCCHTCPEADGFDSDFDISVPVLVDSPDFDSLRNSIRCPVTTKAQISAFAHDILCFGTEQDYEAAQQDELPAPPQGPEPDSPVERAHRAIDRMTLAPVSYFPFGMSVRPKTSMVGFSGKIREVSLVINPVSLQGFNHIVVKTYGGIVVDLVAAPGIVRGVPIEGGILEGICHLSARIASA